ncbi:Ubiquitin-conjugating enzyme E2 14 [Elsinoe australis]|uniref:Ubiquitin-conjugating enzyme E2 14 n=1 Tax=Elsinoe australis TaxID=40998 RepID=A0A2P7Z0T9_9PEZI|nr:Ubiquitin-conjugating enzyme E2 14 [Elsinoe australis]
MPRKKFMQDLELARTAAKPDDIHDLQRGEDDGTFTFLVTNPKLPKPAKVNAMVTDVSSYPTSHEYMIFTDDETPTDVAQAINDHLPSTDRKSIVELFSCIRLALSKLGSTDGDDSEMESEDDDDPDDYDLNEEFVNAPIHSLPMRKTTGRFMSAITSNRIRHDLRTAKKAGFRVAPMEFIFDENMPTFVSISCKVKKLGISHEAMKAWQLKPSEYLVLLIRYPSGYKTAEQLQSASGAAFDVRLRVCDKYKPSQQDALNAFFLTQKEKEHHGTANSPSRSRDTFISGPMRDLIVERLTKLMTYRDSGMTWTGAEAFYMDNQGTSSKHRTMDDSYFKPEPIKTSYPDIVNADHLGTKRYHSAVSFPLVAMQFALRHFVRCTEFCLICHRQLPGDVEALKPYVCSNRLCLYQYMSLGFGPSIDHEILTQPLVIDLLISFCYSNVASGQLKDFPDGLSLTVPASFAEFSCKPPRKVIQALEDDDKIVKMDFNSREVILKDSGAACPFRVGDWVTCRPIKGDADSVHCRIAETMYHPVLRVGELVKVPDLAVVDPYGTRSGTAAQSTKHTAPKGTLTPGEAPVWTEVFIERYDQDFDNFGEKEKRNAIKFLLDTLPSVTEMRDYLQLVRSRELKSWIDRISPSASSVLRWIVASNRACIVQVDELAPPGSNGKDIPALFQKAADIDFNKEERVSGMKGWMQFRFAMGAPDKERRFMQAVRETSRRLNLQYPTAFAWHGSALSNWHSIIREGLHFKKTSNGRAYGHGVYHSQDYNVSLGYTNFSRAYANDTVSLMEWPSSILQITMALSLNELVNAPNEYVSRNPHLVVSDLDWIQTRYLFVKVRNKDFMLESEIKPSNALPQDPTMTPRGEVEPIVLPASATKAGTLNVTPLKRKSNSHAASTHGKKCLRGIGTRDDPMDLDNDGDRSSQATDDEDRAALIDVVDIEEETTTGAEKPIKDREIDLFSETKFRPGHLDFSSLPKMPEPSYASIGTSRRLQADFKALLKIQQSTPAHEIGWYINPSKIDNMYQWIVELHSFDQFKLGDPQDPNKPIPLVTDMEKAGLSSIVLEMRFGPTYPYSPPFVRVLRPRFLGFREGGGGHVTIGGALCMELLTNTGWSSVSSIESVLLQVRLAMASTESPARLNLRPGGGGVARISDYGVGEAVEAYRRACMMHGWQVPEDLVWVEDAAGEGR